MLSQPLRALRIIFTGRMSILHSAEQGSVHLHPDARLKPNDKLREAFRMRARNDREMARRK
jgi:hypothetical protein